MKPHISLLTIVAASVIAGLAQAHTFDVATAIDAEGGARNSVTIGRDSIGLVYDSMGNLGMCYFDDTNDDLKFALHDGNAWAIETAHADQGGDVVGKDCAIVFDDDDNPNIVYFNSTDSVLMHAVKANGRWQQSIIDVRVNVDFFGATRVSIAKDHNGDIAVAYYDRNNRDLKYAKFEMGRWLPVTVQDVGDVGRYASLAFDRNNNPAIAYQVYTDNEHSSLKYIVFDGNRWGQPETIDNQRAAGYFNNLKFDSNGKPHIVYRTYSADERSYYVYYINKVGERWSERYNLAQQQGQATGQYMQMAIDDANNVHIVYMEQFLSALFPDVNYLMMTTLYFADRGMDMMTSRDDRLVFSVIPMIDYAGMAIAVDANYNMVIAWAQESGRNYDLMTARLTAWSPAAILLTPTAEANTGLNTFELRWLDFDPDSNARIRFTRRDANWNSVAFNETARENDDNTISINVSEVPRGEYAIGLEISDDDFNLVNGDWGPANLIVQNHTPTVPVLGSPADNGTVDRATPTVQWAAATDADGDAITYQVQIASDDGFANVVTSGNTGNTNFTPGANLNDNATYFWRVRAQDAAGGNSNWAALRRFATDIPEAAPVVAQAGGNNNADNNANNNNAGGGNAPAGGARQADLPVGGNAPVGASGGHAAGAAQGGGGSSGGGAAGSGSASAAGGSSGSSSGGASAASAAKSGGCSLIRQ